MEAGTALDPFSRLPLGDPLNGLRGTAAPTPLKPASAYATPAADGVYATPYTVAKITRDGRTVYTAHADTRRVLEEKHAYGVREKVLSGAVDRSSAGADSAPTFLTAGAGGGITRRTMWSTGLDSRLALTVVRFADRPGKKKNTTLPAQLPNDPPQDKETELTAAQIWELATSGHGT
ncbi:hypothetical protein ACFPEU_32010 [Streptomyces mangrovi]|uniref:Uncharacterized protein n=1 Tax=Streptomyces mangrovi TaxID=1206892 RepID=A0ABV9IXV4_9ACTN